MIGTVNGSGIYRLRHHGAVVCEATSQDITSGLSYARPTILQEALRTEPVIHCQGNSLHLEHQGTRFETTIADMFHAMLRHPNHASKAAVIRHYDKTVIGNSFVEAGEGDSAVLMPLRDLQSAVPGGSHPDWNLSAAQERIGVAFAGDGNPRYGRISAYWQGVNAAVESMYNVAASGATPRALTDCLNYGNPEIPQQLAALEEGVRGISDASKAIQFEGECVPVISGNVSLYNSLPDGSAIPPSAIVCCIGVMPDAGKALDMQLRSPDSVLILLGERRDECGGSAYYEVLEAILKLPKDALLGAAVPKPDFASVTKQMRLILSAAQSGLLRSSHDISEGGLLLALFEMTVRRRKLGGTIGIDIDLEALKSTLATDKILFSQTPGYIVEVEKSKQKELLAQAKLTGASATVMGKTTTDSLLRIARGGTLVLQEPLASLHAAWEKSLDEALHS
jgi:phosphoribosylformylglycinamidine synthase